MKRLLFVLWFASLFFVSARGQGVPQGISYQAIARESDGDELVSAAISVRISILAGSEDGTIEWQEVHPAETNGFGLFSLIIGMGNSTGLGTIPDFDMIDWGANSHFMKVEIDAPGGGGFELMGTSQLLSVPYSFYSATAGVAINDADSDPANETISYFGINNNLLQIIEAGTSHSVGLDELIGDVSESNELVTDFIFDAATDNLTVTETGNSNTASLSDLEEGNWIPSATQVYNTTQNVGIGTTNPTSKLHVAGSYAAAFTTVPSGSTYTASESDQYILCSITNGQGVIINLPLAGNCPGRLYTVKRMLNGGNGDVTIVPANPNLIEGAGSYIMSFALSQVATFLSDGVNWWLVSYHNGVP